MFYMLKNDVYIRNYDEFGYIMSAELFNDEVFDKSGSVFLNAISRQPQTLQEIAEKICIQFIDITVQDIIADVEEFLNKLVEDGYLTKGLTAEECYDKSGGFSYEHIGIVTPKEDYSPQIIRAEDSSQSVLSEYFLEKPHLNNFQIELTSKCNERCIHCYIPHKFKDTDIEPSLYYSVLDQLEELGVLHLALSGGECTAHPNFKEFLRAAKEKDFHVSILSNLLTIDDEMIQIMKEGNKVSVQTSLYSMIPAHHDEVTTVKGSFEKTRDNILKLIENDIPVQISCPTMNANKDDFADVLRWANKHKIRAFTDYAIMAQYNHDTANLANRLNIKQVKKVIEDILAYDKDYQQTVLTPDFEERMQTFNEDPEEPFCGVGISSCCMVANGNVYPCSGWQSYICGNLNEKSLKEIWLESDEMNYLRGLRKKDIPKCLNCKNRAFCTPCLSRFANESPTGNPLEIATHFCDVAAINRETVLKWRHDVLEKGLEEK